MSKELEALEQIRKFEPFGYDSDNKGEYPLSGTLNDYLEDELDIIKSALERKEKLEKAFEIIKQYNVDFYWLKTSRSVSCYNIGVRSSQALKKEQFDLLKEVLL